MAMVNTYFNNHNHTYYSNTRFYDAINSVPKLIMECYKLGLAGVAITDHQSLAGHPFAEQFLLKHPKIRKKLTVAFGDEIYLVDRDKIQYARKHNKRTHFYHFILTAKDAIGYKFIRILSTKAWVEDSFFFRGQRRLPTYKDWLAKAIKPYRGHVFASTACLGSELSQSILHHDTKNIKKFINYIANVFGPKNVYFELMPAHRKAQEEVNRALWKLSKITGIKTIISTDSHFIGDTDEKAHTIFLKSESSKRDVYDFYHYAHLYSFNQLKNYFSNDVLQTSAKNSLDMMHQIKWIELHHTQEIPKSPIPNKIPKVDLRPYAKKYHIHFPDKKDVQSQLSKYKAYKAKYGQDKDKMMKAPPKRPPYYYVKLYATGYVPVDRFYLRLAFNGLHTRGIFPCDERTAKKYMSRIDVELHVLAAVSKVLKSPMSWYFVTMRRIMDICWNTSIVGPGRGSCGCFVLNYLLYLNDCNPVEYGLPYWRFLSVERAEQGDMPDIDFDTESSQRAFIMVELKRYYHPENVVNFSTFGKEQSKSTIYTCCRGLGIGYIQAQNIANLLPKNRLAGSWPIEDALYGNKSRGHQKVPAFINAVKKYPGLAQAMLAIEGVVRGYSEHASGVYISNEPIVDHNSMMLTSKGIKISQCDAHTSEWMGALKYDVLTLSALDRIHEAFRLLLRDHKIKKQYVNGKYSFRKTYNHYFSTANLDMTSKKMFDMLYKGEVINAFEFSSLVGRSTLLKLNARTFDQLIAANALMRLTVKNGEQPIDRYIRYRDHPGSKKKHIVSDWDKDMIKFGLTKSERKIMHEHLDRFHGVCYSQEALMALSMDPRITFFNKIHANILRKAIAKKDPNIFKHTKKYFYDKGKKQGTRKKLLDYVWENCAVPAKNYSFNLAHGTAYTIILMIEMNICYRFGPIYWQTACLSVNAGMYGSKLSSFKNPDYNKLCHGLGNKFIANKIINPDINHSAYGFVPYKNHILYGLYPIAGISTDDCKKIVKNRPYSSFEDFLKKTKLSKKKNIQLIKSGCFDHINNFNDRADLMKHYVMITAPLKKRLTTTQIPKISSKIPSKYNSMVNAFYFRKQITGRNKVPMNDKIKKAYLKNYANLVKPYARTGQMSLLGNSEQGHAYTEKDGHFKINIKAFNKWYNNYISPLKTWLKSKDALKAEAANRRNKLWLKYCIGNMNSWEMDALGCYIHDHELTNTPISKQVHISDYNKIPTEPKVLYTSSYRGHKYSVKQHYLIYGTVIGKNTNKSLAYILTPTGVANVRVGWRYSRYNHKNKKLNYKPSSPLEKAYNDLLKGSWFDRGTKLMCVGYKRGDNFFLNRTHTPYHNCLYQIIGYGSNAQVYSIKGDLLDFKKKVSRKNANKIQKLNQEFHRQEVQNIKQRMIKSSFNRYRNGARY